MNHVKNAIMIASLIVEVCYAELLIIKKNHFGYEALSEAESLKFNDQISEILQKYQWPMCLGSDLTEQEKNELLSADIPYAEELFIQKKLQQAMPELYLQVVFIPTSLYELFCLAQYFKKEQFFDKKIIDATSMHNYDLLVDFFDLLKMEDLSAQEVRLRIQQTFKQINSLFFDKQKFSRFKFLKMISYATASPVLLINYRLFNFLNTHFSGLNFCKNGQEISQFLQNNVQQMLKILLQEALVFNMDPATSAYARCLLNVEQDDSRHKIIENVVRLEYEARQHNKAMLFRGSNVELMEVSMGKKPVKKSLIGSTLYKEFEYSDSAKRDDQFDQDFDAMSDYQISAFGVPEVPFWKKYKEKNNAPYSISFGISLFAGLVNDPFACAYTYLSGCGHGDTSIHDTSFAKPVGYVVLINKKDYVDHQNNNLFYIPSLATLPSLFEYGQWFHARAKAAKLMKNGVVSVIGAHWDLIKDPTGVLLITRDPLKHAELFSNFLVQNGRLIQPGDASLLTDAEKAFAEDVMKAQIQAADLYKAIRSVTPKIEKATKKFKETRDKKFFDWMHDFENA